MAVTLSPALGRDAIAHDVLLGDLLHSPIVQDKGAGASQDHQTVQGLLGPVFLDDADHGIPVGPPG